MTSVTARPETISTMHTQPSGRAGCAREDKPVPRAAVLASAQSRQRNCRHGESGCGQVVADRVQRAGAVVHDERGAPHGIADPHRQVEPEQCPVQLEVTGCASMPVLKSTPVTGPWRTDLRTRMPAPVPSPLTRPSFPRLGPGRPATRPAAGLGAALVVPLRNDRHLRPERAVRDVQLRPGWP